MVFGMSRKGRTAISAKIEIKALKTALIDYRSKYDGYPTCPNKICTPGECLFLSLAGFHNERGMLEIPPYAPLVPANLFGYDPSSYGVGEIPDFTHNDGKSLILWLSKTLEKDVSFIDPWGNEYAFTSTRGRTENQVTGFFQWVPTGQRGRALTRMTLE